MEFKREYYINKLIQKQHNGLIKVITGIRRCGKSYLLFTLFKNYLKQQGTDAEHIIELPFDSYENIKYRNPDVFLPYIKALISDDETYYILLDEIQLLDQFEAVLNSIMRIKNVDVYVTGSNAKFLSKDIITEFRGRGDELHIQPLSFSEFMDAYDGNKYDGWNQFILYGGLPPVVLLESPEAKIELLSNLFKETYIKDIVGRNKLRNEAEIDELLNILASSIGSLTNPNKLSNAFASIKKINISPKTVKRYLDCLCDSFLIQKAMRYDIKGKSYIDTPLKYYYTDIGLRNARINFRQLEETHTMENVIFNELIARGYNVDVGVVPISERDKNGKAIRKQLEIDFICNKGSGRYYIQSAFAVSDSAKMLQESKALNRTGDSFRKIIITKDSPMPWHTDKGILVMSIYDFLLNRNSLDM